MDLTLIRQEAPNIALDGSVPVDDKLIKGVALAELTAHGPGATNGNICLGANVGRFQRLVKATGGHRDRGDLDADR